MKSRASAFALACAPPLDALTAERIERWRSAGLCVRLCVDADEPLLVERYLELGNGLHARGLLAPWDIALQSTLLLLDTAADTELPLHWRGLCLDQVHRPLGVLAERADDDKRRRQFAALSWRLATLDFGA